MSSTVTRAGRNGGVLRVWQPGESGNPAGRSSLGAAFRVWLNQLQDNTRTELRAVVSDKTAPASKVMAARTILRAASGRVTTAGHPIAGSDVDRAVLHTEGPPVQRHEILQASVQVHGFDPREFAQAWLSLGLGEDRLPPVVAAALAGLPDPGDLANRTHVQTISESVPTEDTSDGQNAP